MSTRGFVVQLRVSKSEEAAAKRVAKSRGVSVAEAIRQLVTEEDAGISGAPATVRGETRATASATRRGE